MALLVVFFLVSIIFSFLCSLWEASLLTIPPSYVEARSQEGSSTGKILKAFKKDVDIPLSAILTLNTIAHTVGAIGVGAQATKIWPENSTVTGIVIPVVMTLAILILSEIIPKTIGATYWRGLAGFTATTLNICVNLLRYTGILYVSQLITKLFKGKGHGSTMSRTDMAALATLSEREGILKANESAMMQNLLRSQDIQVKDIMTPRTVMLTAKASMTIEQFLDAHADLRFSRIPLTRGSIDKIDSYVLKDEILLAGYRGKAKQELGDFERKFVTVDATTPMPVIFDTLVSKQEHLALVLGEFGGTAGLVSQEDVIETLLGLEIVDESDDTVDMQALAQEFRDNRRKETDVVSDSTIDPAGELRAKKHEASGGADIGLTGHSDVTES